MAVEAKVVVVPKVKGPLEIHSVVLPNPGPHQEMAGDECLRVSEATLHEGGGSRGP